MRKFSTLLFIITCFGHLSNAQDNSTERGFQAITIDALKGQTGFLASEWTEGRETGKKGAYMSADYIASMLQTFGVKPAGDFVMERDPVTRRPVQKQSYFQNFSLMTTTAGEIQEMSVRINETGAQKIIDFKYGTDFIITPSYPGGTVTAPLVFVGYGYKDDESGYNDFKGMNIKGKIVLRLSGLPASHSADNSQYAIYRASMQKDVTAYELGAAGILDVDPANIDGSAWTPSPEFLVTSPSERGARQPRIRYRIPDKEIGVFAPKASISLKVANALLTGSGISISDYASGVSSITKPVKGFNNIVTIRTSVITELIKVRNVIGMIEGNNIDEVIILGAHYDHLGKSSGYTYNGADDNASGTVGVLTIARAIAATGVKPEKTILFVLWTGEEKGLLGSRYYTDNPTVQLQNIRLNVNFDMISRYVTDDDPDKVTMTYSSSCPEFKDLTLNNLNLFKIALEPDYQPSDNPPGGSDHRSFVSKGIPIMRFKPGHREEYHTPADEVSTLDWDIMQKVVQISFLNVWELATSDW